MDSLDQQKRALRAEVRKRMPPPQSAGFIAASLLAQERLSASALVERSGVIALYRALPSECGTAALAASLSARGKDVCYPVVVAGQRVLDFRRASGDFVAGALGIEEPAGARVALEEIELLVVPAIAVDLRGGRLGRGRGHYDATLAAARGTSVALLFEVQLVAAVPVGEDDRPVAAFCTEKQLVVVR